MLVWTEAKVERALAAFREHGPRWSTVARATGCARATAKRLWLNGLRARGDFPGTPPLRDVIADEQVRARALRSAHIGDGVAAATALARPPAPEQACAAPGVSDPRQLLASCRDDIIHARLQTGHILRQQKEALGGLTPSLARMVGACGQLSERVVRRLAELEVRAWGAEDEAKNPGASLTHAIALVREVHQMQRDFASTLQLLLDMERRELGDPAEIAGQEVADARPDEEVVAEHKAFLESLEHIDVEAWESAGRP